MSSALFDHGCCAGLAALCDVRWQSPTPNANGRFWRIYRCGNVERMPRGWKP